MAYFNYHAKAKNLIKSGHCTRAAMEEKYHGIIPALVLYFDNNIPMPIRLHRFDEYFELLKLCGINVEYIYNNHNSAQKQINSFLL